MRIEATEENKQIKALHYHVTIPSETEKKNHDEGHDQGSHFTEVYVRTFGFEILGGIQMVFVWSNLYSTGGDSNLQLW